MSPLRDSAARRILPEGRLAGPMPWVIAIMTFLTVLAAAGGIALGGAASALARDLAGRLTVEIVEANAPLREAQARAALAELGKLSDVTEAARVDDARLRGLLTPWLGDDGLDAGLPMPALIDVTLAGDAAIGKAGIERALRAAAPGATVEAHAALLAPLAHLLSTLRWLAVGLVVLMASATAAAVVLAARAAMNTHRPTIDVMHLMGASDGQIAGLFQRRAALDAAFGGALGLIGGAAAVLAMGRQFAALDAALIDRGGLGWLGWLVLLLVPVAGVAVSVLTARVTILAALARKL